MPWTNFSEDKDASLLVTGEILLGPEGLRRGSLLDPVLQVE